jgi:hypothetical protein
MAAPISAQRDGVNQYHLLQSMSLHLAQSRRLAAPRELAAIGVTPDIKSM